MSRERGDRGRGRLPLALAAPLIALACAAAAALGAGPGAAAAAAATPTPSSAPAASAAGGPAISGADVYAQNCSGCHGAEGEGNAKGPFYGPTLVAAAAPSLVSEMVERGRLAPTPALVQMPAFAGVLSDVQIQAVADYVSGQLADRAAREARVGEGGKIFRLYCSGCHSAAGSGGAIVGGTNAPNIRQHPSAVAIAAMILGPANMPVFAGNTLDVPQQTAVALYLEALSTASSPGGADLGYIGPVAEGFVAAIALAGLVLFAVWLEWGKGRARD